VIAPLDGVLVVDVSRFVSGPLCTFFLASMGAEVLAVEPPVPSASRRLPPLAAPGGGSTAQYEDGAIAMPFLKRARGKRSVAIDITRPEGQELVRTLAARADVFVENSRRGTMAAFGLDHATLAAANPRLVTCSISGYGQDGPDPDRPAMDNIVQAVSGLMARTGFADGPPLRAGTTVADHATATFAALGIVAALHQRERTGTGQVVDVAMNDVLTAFVWDEPVDHYAAIGLPARTGNADARGAPINTYRCADGWISVTCTSDAQWQGLCERMGRPDLATAYPDARARAAGAREIDAAVEAWTSGLAARAVESEMHAVGLPAGRVRDPLEARDDPQTGARGLLEPLRHAESPPDSPSGYLGPVLPIAFAGRVPLAPAERLGASTAAVLRDYAGCDDARLAQLRGDGVVGLGSIG
jgi:crotonobetainyl-CoA:carnitine CoA-transferase CaiB-like acyl-CoA transferase